jgi:Domain of unknown function (DUF397)
VPTPDLTHVAWRKSSRSNGAGNACVEVAFVPDATALRDSKNPDGGVLVLPATGWHAFRLTTK